MSKVRDFFRKFFVGSTKTPADATLSQLGLNVVNDGVLVQRLRDIQNTINQIYEFEPEEKIKACDMLVKLVATAWIRAGSNRYSAIMMIHWEHLVKIAEWFVQVLKKEQREESIITENIATNISNLKYQVNKVLDIILVPYAKMVIDVSFNNQDVVPQFIAVVREQQPMFRLPAPQSPMYGGEIGQSETGEE